MMRPIPFLPVIGAVEEADSGAGKHHQRANGKRRRLIVLWGFIELGELDEALGDQDEQPGKSKSDERRESAAPSDTLMA